MKIAVPSYSPGGLEAEVCPHLGHAEFVTVVEVEGSRPIKVEVVDCRGQHYGFARRPVEVLSSLSVDAVAVKGLGARALDWLRQSGIKVYRVNANRVADAVAEVAEGRASEVSVEEACVGGGGGFTAQGPAWWPPYGPMAPASPWGPPRAPMPGPPAQPPLRPSGAVRVAVATQGRGGLDDLVSPVFGRCPTFTVVDVEGGEIKGVQVVPNQAAQAAHGAGIAAVQALANLGVKVALAGRFGPWAQQAMMQFGIQAIMVPPGITVRDAVLKYVLGR